MSSKDQAVKPGQTDRVETPEQAEVSPETQSVGTLSFSPKGPLTRARILQLQRTIGNQAVQRLIQNARQLKNNSPGINPVKEVQRAQVAADRGNGYGTLENTEESFGTDGGKRQTGLKGFALPDPFVREPGKNAAPLSFVTTGIDEANMPAELRGYDRGHIMAVSSSGPNISENVVPQHPRVNGGGAWKKFEGKTLSVANKLHNKVDNKGQNLGVFVEVSIDYDDPDSRIPSSFGVKATLEERKLGKGSKSGKKRRLKGKLKEKEKLHGNTINAMKTKLAALSVAQIDNKGIALTPIEIQTRQNDLKKARGDAKNKPPVNTATLGPLPPGDYRPNAALEGTLPGFTPDQSNFKKEQIQMILAYNIKKNGQLLSDAPNDRYPVLKEHGKMSRPEIDHIVPKTNGGFNAFSNARVVSKWLNRHKERVVSAKEKRKRLKTNYDPVTDTKYKARKTGVHTRQFGFRTVLKNERTLYETLKRQLLTVTGSKTGDYKTISNEIKNIHNKNVTEINTRYLQAVANNRGFDEKAVTKVAVANLEPARLYIEKLSTKKDDHDDGVGFESDSENDVSEVDSSVNSSEDSTSGEDSYESSEEEMVEEGDSSSEESSEESSDESSEESDEDKPPRKKIAIRKTAKDL